MNPTKILMVCLGNICRSPLAQGILESKASKNIAVDPSGTGRGAGTLRKSKTTYK